MTARIDEPKLREAFEVMHNAGPRGRELAALLDRRATRVRISARIVGGFTLNFINTIFLQPLAPDTSAWEYRRWVTILAHEACHVEQGFWVDSVQQEIIAYQTQCRVAIELGIDLVVWREAFAALNPASPHDQTTGRAHLLALFANEPAGVVYAALPLRQPRGLRAFAPGVRQIAAVLRASRRTQRT